MSEPTFERSDRVRITGGPAPKAKLGALGTVYRRNSDPGMSIDRYLVYLDDGSKGWFYATALEIAAPLVEGDRVQINDPTFDSDRGVITSAHLYEFNRFLVRRDSNGAVHGYPGYMLSPEPATGRLSVRPPHEQSLPGTPAPKGRVLVIGIPLTNDPSEDPTDVTELIDFIAEHHDKVTFTPKEEM